MKGNFNRCLKEVLSHEGGWSNHPNDPGGATMKGVTQRVYDAYTGRKRSVRNITDDEIEAIYRLLYWNKIEGDALPRGVDLAVFDAAVNSGPFQAAKWLQRSVGTVADGVIGPVTIAATLSSDLSTTVSKICDARLRFLKRLKTWKTFGKGWSRRVAAIRQAAAA